jgi:hypothetical protein
VGASGPNIDHLLLATSELEQAFLLAHYAFNDGTADDSSGRCNHGALAGTAVIVNDPVQGNVLSLNGADSKVDLGNPLSLQITGDITVAAWFNATAFGPGNQNNIVNKGHDDASLPTDYRRPPRRYGTNYNFGTWESGRTPSEHMALAAYPAGDVGTSIWVHLAGTCTLEGSLYKWRLYRNWILVGISDAFADGMLPVNFGWVIGTRGDVAGLERVFNGLIDDVRIYNIVLCAREIQRLSNIFSVNSFFF